MLLTGDLKSVAESVGRKPPLLGPLSIARESGTDVVRKSSTIVSIGSDLAMFAETVHYDEEVQARFTPVSVPDRLPPDLSDFPSFGAGMIIRFKMGACGAFILQSRASSLKLGKALFCPAEQRPTRERDSH
jgi:hypothetical protein